MWLLKKLLETVEMKKNTLATKVLEDMIVYQITWPSHVREKKNTPIFINSGKSNNCFWHEKKSLLLLLLFYLEISIVLRKDRSKYKPTKKHPVTCFSARRSHSTWSCSRAWKNEMIKFLVGALIFLLLFKWT